MRNKLLATRARIRAEKNKKVRDACEKVLLDINRQVQERILKQGSNAKSGGGRVLISPYEIRPVLVGRQPGKSRYAEAVAMQNMAMANRLDNGTCANQRRDAEAVQSQRRKYWWER